MSIKAIESGPCCKKLKPLNYLFRMGLEDILLLAICLAVYTHINVLMCILKSYSIIIYILAKTKRDIYIPGSVTTSGATWKLSTRYKCIYMNDLFLAEYDNNIHNIVFPLFILCMCHVHTSII